MKITRTAFVALFFVGVTFAQIGDEGPDDGVRLPEALIEELGLAESQIAQLRANNQSFREQVRPLAQDAAAKRRELRQEKRSESPNETVLGTLTMERCAVSYVDTCERRRLLFQLSEPSHRRLRSDAAVQTS